MTKKVVIILTEGITDEYILKKFLDRRYKTKNFKFKVYGGDAFSDRKNANEPIKNTIGNLVLQIIKYEKFKQKDILTIIQLTDTDGCMISDNDIIIKTNQCTPTNYSINNIFVNSFEQKNNIIERNQRKKRKTEQMIKTEQVCNGKYQYRIYYFSRNIEHVFFNDLNPKEEEKVKNALNFSKESDEKYQSIFNTNTPSLTNCDTNDKYKSSWDFIKKGINSLQRYTNFSFLLEFLDSLS